MQIQQLRYVLKIAEKKSFSMAAKELYISQPSLSQQIAKLEQELGLPLFIRHSKSVSLTDAGEQFVIFARRIINNMNQLSDLMGRYSRLQDGKLRVGILWVGGYLQIPHLLTEFHRQYPGITYEVRIEGSTTLLQLLLARFLNAVFIIDQEQHLQKEEDLYYIKLMNDYYVAVMNRKHPLASKKVLKIEDFQNQSIIMPSPDSAFRGELEQVFESHFVTPQVICETSQSDIGMQLAAQGMAIHFASNSIAQALKTEDHVILPLEITMNRTIFYVTLKELLEHPVTAAFTEFIRSVSEKPL